MPGLETLVKMASGQKETVSHLANQNGLVGFGQGARIGNFDQDGVKAKGVKQNIFIWKKL